MFLFTSEIEVEEQDKLDVLKLDHPDHQLVGDLIKHNLASLVYNPSELKEFGGGYFFIECGFANGNQEIKLDKIFTAIIAGINKEKNSAADVEYLTLKENCTDLKKGDDVPVYYTETNIVKWFKIVAIDPSDSSKPLEVTTDKRIEGPTFFVSCKEKAKAEYVEISGKKIDTLFYAVKSN